MVRHIEEINIETYRGMKDLKIHELGDINIFVGGNNCGKTSLLEALQILTNPRDFVGIVRVSRGRDRFRKNLLVSSPSILESFLNIFDKNCERKSISMSYSSTGKKVALNLNGEVEMLTHNSLEETNVVQMYKNFTGILSVEKDGSDLPIQGEVVNLNKYSKFKELATYRPEFTVHHLSTFDHIVDDSLGRIIKDEPFKEEVIELLKIIDEDIYDLEIVPSGDGRYVESICHQTLGTMPISTYGDGIKKVIAIGNSILSAQNGVLLIDDIETALHPSLMDKMFSFLISASKKNNVQVFTTTHSLNFLTKIQQDLESVRVITLEKGKSQTLANVLDVKSDKISFDL